MQTRRAPLAAGVAVATGGCVSVPATEPFYTIDARTVDPQKSLPTYSIDPNGTVTRRLLLASPTDADGCLSPGTYSFETTYHASSADEELRWTFEIEISES